jgi:hypothetical protein
MINTFSEFTNENFNPHDGTLGDYISGLAETDERVREIVASYTMDVDQSVNMSNAINILSDTVKISLLKNVEDHVNGVEGELKVTTSSEKESTDIGDDEDSGQVIELIDESYGSKGIFTSFLKCLTALGFKDNTVSNDNKSNFLFLFRFIGRNGEEVKQVFNRFASLKKVHVDESKRLSLYYGLRTDGMIEYGSYSEDFDPIGEFKLGKREFNIYKTSELKSLSGFKRLVVDIDYSDILTFIKLKMVMGDFDPGHVQSKMQPEINSRIMTFGYYGYGTWSGGNLSPEDLDTIKNNIKEYLSKYKWTKQCQIALDARGFWVYVNIRLK